MLRMIRIIVLINFLVLGLTSHILAHHQEMEKNSEWNPVSAGPITSWTAPLCGKGKFVAQPFLFYNRSRGTFNNNSHYDSLPPDDRKYQFQEQIFMQYGLTEELEVDAQTVYQENYRKQGEQKAHSNGLGDSYLFLRYCAIEEGKFLPHITALFQIKFPTGKFEGLDPNKLGTDAMGATSGGGSYDQGFGVNLTKKIKPFILHLDAIYSFPQRVKIDGVKTKYANYLNYDFGLEYFLNAGFNLMLELNGFLQGDKEEAAKT